jgi:hypothetical protein
MKCKFLTLILGLLVALPLYADTPVSNGAYRLSSGRSPSRVLSVNASGKLVVTTKNTSDLSQVWLLEKTGDGSNGTAYIMRNANSALYVQGQETVYQSFYTDSTVYNLYVRSHPSLTGYYNFSSADNFTGTKCMHEDASGNIVPWSPGTGTSASGTEWKLEKVTEFTDAQIRESITAKSPYTTIATGKPFRILSATYGRAMCVNISDNTVTTEARANDVAQYWKFVKTSAGYRIKNLYTNRYIQKQNGTRSQQYATSSTASGAFTITENANYPYDVVYDIKDAGSIGLHCASTQGYKVVGWDISDGVSNRASAWVLEPVNISDEEIAAANKQYQDNQKLINSTSTIRSRLRTFFSDYACTQLKDQYAQMSDSALSAAMSALPQQIIDIALKVKNNSWDKWEQTFREAKYGAYSNPEYWGSTLTMTPYGRQNNPTGITADKNELMFVFVDSDVPSGASLSLETASTTSVWGSYSKDLVKGLNIFFAPEDNSQIYINYISANGSLISSYDSIRIHIEGGRVNGYFDNTLYSDDDWVEMNNDGLFSGPVIDVKSKYVMMHMNSTLFKQNVGNQIHRIMGVWDKIVHDELNLMGLLENDQHPDIWEGVYPSKFNNLMECASITGDGYMYSTNNYTAYNETTLSTVLNYSVMSTGESIWGPAHEIGHSNQSAIKIIGSTEISNNLFSNVMVYLTGNYTSRGWNLQDEQPMLADRQSWPERYNSGAIMSLTQMFYSMYLYFHVLGNDTTFYQKVFHTLRNDPLSHPANPGITYGKNDYLKFARVCAKVAGANLNDFFQYWGFYFPVENLAVSDYADYTVTTTQADIDATKEYIANCGKPLPQLIFMEDRVRPVKKADGTYKLSLSDNPYSECKSKMGQYEDYPLNLEPSGYIYTVSSAGVVSVPSAAKNAVGMIVYDKDSNLVYVANTYSFTLPSYVLQDGGYKIYSVRSDGTLTRMYNRTKDTYYTMRVYREGNRTAITHYTDGLSASGTIPTLSGNDMGYVITKNAPESLTGLTNVISVDKTAENVVLDDSVGYYAPVDFTAKSLTFTSHLSSRINNKAFPFAFPVTAAGDYTVETVGSIAVQGDSTLLKLVSVGDSVKAGQPVFFSVKNSAPDSWTYTANNVSMLGSGRTETIDDVSLSTNFADATYNGTLWQYSPLGLCYSRTQDSALPLTPFASWLQSSTADAPDNYYLSSELVNGISTVKVPAKAGAHVIYNVEGMRVTDPVKGGIYIIDGKKQIYK